jgi:DNA-binding transcriptional LysR family regulator
MELRQLRYFVEVAEQLHFGRAAERLHIGQPAVSQQIRRLEQELWLSLFDRSSRLVRLSAAGRGFLPEARAVLAAADRAELVAAELSTSGSDSVLRLGTTQGLGVRLDAVMERLAGMLPKLRVELVSTSSRARVERVRSGQLDAAFVRGEVGEQGIRAVPVWRDPLVVALPSNHELAHQSQVRLEELAQLPLRIVPRRLNPPLVDLVMSACHRAGFEPSLEPSLGSMQDLLATIATGPPTWSVVYAAQVRVIPSDRVAFRPPSEPMVVPTTLVLPEGTESRAAASLISACRSFAAVDHDR